MAKINYKGLEIDISELELFHLVNQSINEIKVIPTSKKNIKKSYKYESKNCIICGEMYNPYNTFQKICGSKSCVKEKARRYAKEHFVPKKKDDKGGILKQLSFDF